MPYIDTNTNAMPVWITDATGTPIGSAGNPLVTTGGSGASSNQVQGTAASGTAKSGSPVRVGYSDGTNAQDLLGDTSGNAYVTLRAAGSTNPITFSASGLADNATNTISGLFVVSRGYISNGSSWDRQRKPNNFSRLASSAATGSPTVAKASAGDVMQFWGQNGAAITYLQIYNKASAPVLGTDTPVLTYPIPASAGFSQTIPNGGAYFGTGISYAFTTDVAGTTAAAAAAVVSFAMLVA